jgi:hypothetical protein
MDESRKKPRSKHRVQKTTRSPAQREASRKNGACSRGPKSPETKRTSSMNSLKFGFYAESDVIPGESIEEYQYERDLWLRRHGATEGGPQFFFAISSFRAAWRYQRGERALHAQTLDDIASARAAHGPDPEIERIEAERIAEKIHQEPRETLISLMNLPAGCELLASRFEALLKATRDDDCLFPSQNARLGALLGKRPQDVLEDELLYDLNRWYLGMMRPAELGLTIDNVMGIYADTMPEHSKGYRGDEVKCRINHVLTNELPSSGAEAAALQRQFIAARISALRDRAARLRRERAARAERAAAAAPLSGSVESARRDRHLAMNYRRAELGSALARKLRKEWLADLEQNEKPSGSDRPAARGSSEENGERRQEIHPAPRDPPPSPLPVQPPVSGARGPGPDGGVLPLLALLLLLLLRGPGPAPHHDRDALLGATPLALGAWGRSPQGQTPEAQPPVPATSGASPASGRLIPSHPRRRASLLNPHRQRVRRASQRAWGRSPQGKTPDVRPPQPATGRLERGAGRAAIPRGEAHRHRPAHRWTSRRVAAFDPPSVCRNEPELGASRAACAESSSPILRASRIALRPRDSPGLRGPPPERP